MSKYNPLWEELGKREGPSLTLTFKEIEALAGVPLDHSFLQYKKELAAFGQKEKRYERTG